MLVSQKKVKLHLKQVYLLISEIKITDNLIIAFDEDFLK